MQLCDQAGDCAVEAVILEYRWNFCTALRLASFIIQQLELNRVCRYPS